MKKTPKLKITVYQDRKKEYRWNIKRCGRIVAESGEGYKRTATCLKSLTNLVKSIEAMNYEYELQPKK